MDQLQPLGSSSARRQRDDRRVGIAIAGLDLVNMGKGRGRLKGAVELELPTERDGVTVEALEVRRGRSVSFDLVALSVECDASIVVWHHVNVKHEHVSTELAVEFLSDVPAKIGVAAIGSFHCGAT